MDSASAEPGLILRAALTSDDNFIRSTWLNELRKAPNGLPDAQWWPAHRAYVEHQLYGGHNRILIAGASDDPHAILGYAVASEEVLEWVHVRPGLRGRGLAGVLLRELGFSHEQKPRVRWRTRHSRDRLKTLYQPAELRK